MSSVVTLLGNLWEIRVNLIENIVRGAGWHIFGKIRRFAKLKERESKQKTSSSLVNALTAVVGSIEDGFWVKQSL